MGTYRKLTNRCDLDALIRRKLFLSFWKVQLLRVDFFEFAVTVPNALVLVRVIKPMHIFNA